MTSALDNSTTTAARGVWLFSMPVDLSVFLGSAIISLLLLAYGASQDLLRTDTPEWTWVPFVLLVDVAHVYATGFRVYFDPQEVHRRPLLYFGAPLAAFLIGMAIYSKSSTLFWSLLAYLAVFHFVRQQYGWVALYRAKAREPRGWQKWIDTLAIYMATIYPLIYWHAHLPMRFWWFLEDDFVKLPGDFVKLPALLATAAAPLYCLALAAYFVKAGWQWSRGRQNPGKDVVVVTTALCWGLGIVAFNSDYAFTVTNVIIHGVPYMALVYWYVRANQRQRGNQKWGWASTLVAFLATVWLLAYVEELFWDRGVWRERSWLFGASFDESLGLETWLAPLLATPQITHYVLDGFIWRRKSNPKFSLV